MRTGSWTLASHRSGSTLWKSARVWSSHDQRRLKASSSSAASDAGSEGRTVKLRSAFIERAPYPSAADPCPGGTEPVPYAGAVLGRIMIDDVRPSTPGGRFPAKAVVGDDVTVSAVIFQ